MGSTNETIPAFVQHTFLQLVLWYCWNAIIHLCIYYSVFFFLIGTTASCIRPLPVQSLPSIHIGCEQGRCFSSTAWDHSGHCLTPSQWPVQPLPSIHIGCEQGRCFSSTAWDHSGHCLTPSSMSQSTRRKQYFTDWITNHFFITTIVKFCF